MKAFITIVGLNSYYGTAPFHEGQKLTLVKEPENRHDKEAIRVELPGLGLVGSEIAPAPASATFLPTRWCAA